ncbi:MAG: hypothetical protein QOC98_2518, partial [Frankiaceae bacterium]|nr:hypothetical protein [Frankiaceae bacterium]
EPHTYDLCDAHADRLTVPRGWEVVHIEADPTPRPPSSDDLEALANAVREAARPPAAPSSLPGRNRGHLRVIPNIS